MADDQNKRLIEQHISVEVAKEIQEYSAAIKRMLAQTGPNDVGLKFTPDFDKAYDKMHEAIGSGLKKRGIVPEAAKGSQIEQDILSAVKESVFKEVKVQAASDHAAAGAISQAEHVRHISPPPAKPPQNNPSQKPGSQKR